MGRELGKFPKIHTNHSADFQSDMFHTVEVYLDISEVLYGTNSDVV